MKLCRAGKQVTIRMPTEREERVRDLVRCRETHQAPWGYWRQARQDPVLKRYQED